jgi:hypothetical protein
MEDSAVSNNSLPQCFNQTHCYCFDNLFKKPIHFNETDVIQYTSFYLKELTNYIENLEEHSRLDTFFNVDHHTTIAASEVKKSNDLFLQTICKFQLQLLIEAKKGEFYCKHFNEDMNVSQLINFYHELSTLNSKSIHLFNNPNSPLPVKNLTDILEIHRNCLYIFQQFYNVAQYGRALFIKDNYNINIHNFQFRHSA